MGYTLENMGKRMITSNLLRNKRKLVDEAEKAGIAAKRQKLSGEQYANLLF